MKKISLFLLIAILICSCDKEVVYLDSDNLYPFDDANSLYGYMDNSGQTVIEPQFKSCRNFSHGLAFVINSNNEYGYINKDGSIVIQTQRYSSFDFTDDGLARSCIDNKCGYIDTNGEYIVTPQYSDALDFSEGLAAVSTDDKWGFINKKGEMVIPPKYSAVSSFSDGYAKVQEVSGGLYGFINKSGDLMIENKYNNASDFCNGYCSVKTDKYAILINKKEDTIVNIATYNIGNYKEKLISYSKNSSYGYLDINGKPVINPAYDFADDFSGGLGLVANYEGIFEEFIYGYIDANGEPVIPLKFIYASPFNRELAVFASRNGTWGYIDKKGNIIWQSDHYLSIEDISLGNFQ